MVCRRTKNIGIKYLLITVILLAIHLLLHAQNQNDSLTQIQQDSLYKKTLMAIPVIFYKPETRWGGGAVGMLNFYMEKNESTRPSTIAFYSTYTQNKQIIVRLPVSLFLKNNSYWIRTELETYKYPLKIFPPGKNTDENEAESFTPLYYKGRVTFMKNMASHLYVGFQYEFIDYTIIKKKPNSKLIHPGGLIGSRGGRTSGAGISLRYDTRDNIFSTTKGYYLEFQTYSFLSLLGSEYNYNYFNTNLRWFHPFFSHDVFATQFYAEINSGDVPFYKQAKLGGDMRMRGYYKGRYTDKVYFMVQSEYRKHIYGRFGVVAFAGFGDVGENAKDFALGSMKYSLGGGLRFMLDKKEKISIRVDYAIGKNSTGLYFTAHESF